MEDLVQAYLVVDVEPLHTPEINIVHAEPLVSFFERHQRLFRGLIFVGVTFIFLGVVFTLAVILPEIIKEQYREASLVRIVLEESNISSIKELGCSQALAKNWILGSSNLQLDPKKDRDQIAQRYILATLFYSMGGENSKNRGNFLSPDNKCNWYPEAVACSRHDKVLNISFESNNLQGSLPQEIGGFEKMQKLYFFNSNLHGMIPTELGRLAFLIELTIYNNEVS